MIIEHGFRHMVENLSGVKRIVMSLSLLLLKFVIFDISKVAKNQLFFPNFFQIITFLACLRVIELAPLIKHLSGVIKNRPYLYNPLKMC